MSPQWGLGFDMIAVYKRTKLGHKDLCKDTKIYAKARTQRSMQRLQSLGHTWITQPGFEIWRKGSNYKAD